MVISGRSLLATLLRSCQRRRQRHRLQTRVLRRRPVTLTGVAGMYSERLEVRQMLSSANPTIGSLAGAVTYTEKNAPLTIEPVATVTDADSPTFNGGALTISVTANGENTDVLGIRNQGTGAGQIGVSGSNVTYGGTTIGTVSGGTFPSALVISFNSSSSPTSAQALLRNITFASTSSNPSTLNRSLSINLTDGGGGTRTVSQTAKVVAVNDAPAIGAFGGDISYTEGPTPSLIAGSATITDPDSPHFSGTLTVSLAGSEATDRLSIINQGTGAGQIGVSGSNVTYGGTTIGTFTGGSGATPLVVTFNSSSSPAAAQALLRDIGFSSTSSNPATNNRTVSVSVTDGDGGSAGPLSKSISVTAVNDLPVVTPGQSFNVSEAAANNAPVGTVLATDAENNSLSNWQIVSGNIGDVFAINPATGVIKVANNATLDYETLTSYTLGITVFDGTDTSAVQAVTINVLDFNEFAVSAISDNDAGANQVTENAPAGTPVGITAFASDADGTTNIVTYSLDDNAGGLFTINTSTGVVTTTAPLDYEAVNSYQITVRATSQDGSSSTANFTINVLDQAVVAYVDGSGNLIVGDVAGEEINNNLTVAVNGSNLRIHEANGPLAAGAGATQIDNNTIEVPLASITGSLGVQLNTGAGNDQVTIDFTNGALNVPISLDGGAATDSLTLTGGTYTYEDYSFSSDAGGVIYLEHTRAIDFSGLETITDTATAANLTINGTSGSDSFELTNGASDADGLLQLQVNGAAPISFSGKSNLKLTGGDGNDEFDVNFTEATAGLDSIAINPLRELIPDIVHTLDLNQLPSSISLSANVETVNLNLHPTPGTVTSTATTVNVAGTAKIQDGVNLVSAGGTVNVADGTYVENVLINKNVKLLSAHGRASTTIQGISGVGSLGAVLVTNNTTGVTIGQTDHGFTIIGIDNGNPSIENAAVYFQGSHSGAKIQDNEIRANGDEALVTEYGATISNFLIDHNTFSGMTFVGTLVGGIGFGSQFTTTNVPRQLVVMGNGGGTAGTALTTNVTFTNNDITGVAGGISVEDGVTEQGNTLVTIDAANSTITGNTFEGATTRFGAALRVRRPDTVISGNTFDSSRMKSQTEHLFVQNNTTPLGDIVAANTFDRGAYVNNGQDMSVDLAAGISRASAGDTLHVLAGNYTLTSDVTLNKSISIVGPNAGVSPVTNLGSRSAEAVVSGGASSFTGSTGYDFVLASGITSLSVQGLKFTGFDGNMFESSLVPVTNVSMSDNIFDGNNGGILYKFDTSVATHFNVSDNLIQNQSMAGVNTALFFLGNVANSHFDGNKATNITSRELFNFYDTLTSTTISGNILNTTGGLAGLFANTSGVTLDGNSITNTTAGNAITVDTFIGQVIDDVEITNNTISGVVNGTGITLSTSFGFDLHPTTSSITNVLIEGNTISSTSTYGINISTTANETATISNISVLGNSFVNNAFGPILAYSQPGTGANVVSNLTVDGNTFSEDAGIFGSAFYLADFRNVSGVNSFSSNFFTLSGTLPGGTDAIRALALRGSQTGNWTISQNDFDGGGVTHNNSPTVFVTAIALLSKDATAGNLPATATINITQNSIHGFEDGLVVRDGVTLAYGNLAAGIHVNVTGNSIAGNSLKAIRSGTGGEVLNASGNWWGSTDESVISSTLISGAVDFSPFLDSGLDSDAGTAGFQPTKNVVHVTALGSQSGAGGRINEGVSLVNSGGTVLVGAGTYAEAVAVDKFVKLDGTGSGTTAADTIIDGSSAGAGNAFLAALTITASGLSDTNRLTISDLHIQGSQYSAIVVGGGSNASVSHLTLENVTGYGGGLTGDTRGIYLGGSGQLTDLVFDHIGMSGYFNSGIYLDYNTKVDGFALTNSNLSDNRIAFDDYADLAGSTSNGDAFTNVTITGNTIANNSWKGLYFEKISNAVISGNSFQNNGTGLMNHTTPLANNGYSLELNVKGGTHSNIQITNNTFDVSGTNNLNSGAMAVKARSDAPSYSANPGVISDVTVSGNVFKNLGTSKALVIGEPGKNAPTPANLVITGNQLSDGTNPGLVNGTTGQVTAENNWWGVSDSATIQSNLVQLTSSGTVDFTPFVDLGVSGSSVAENLAPGQTVGSFSTTGSLDSTSYTYTLVSGTGGSGNASFTIDPSGNLLTADAFDAEGQSSYSIRVRSTDDRGRFTDKVFTISITDVNEYDVGPVEDMDSANNEVTENSPAGALVGITAQAADADLSDSVSYSLDDNGGGFFQINPTTGVVTTTAPLDYESAHSRQITVRATSTDGSFSTETFTINVLDVNDNPPVVTPGQSFNVSEDAANSFSLGTVAATDADSGTTVFQNWQIVSGNDDGVFAINPDTGEITVADNSNLDHETTSSYTLTISVFDGVNTGAGTVTINVLDVNEYDIGPIQDMDDGDNYVVDHAAAGAYTGITAQAVDADFPDGSNVTYSLSDSAGGLFTINPATGVVTTTAVLNANVASSYQITVRADSTDGSYSEETFTVAVIFPVIVTESGGSTDVTEGLTTDSYTLSLPIAPTSPVTITVTAGTGLQVSLDGVNFFSSVDAVFSSADSRTITVRAINDSVAMGFRTVDVTQVVSDSADPHFPVGLSIPSVSVHVTDDDVASVVTTDGTIPITSVNVLEGAVASYQVALTSIPTGAVIITLTADPAVRISKNGINWYSSLTITRTNRQAIVIYVQAVDNNVVDGSRTVQITQAITSSSDPNYPVGALPDFQVNIADDDVASVVTTDGTNPITSVNVLEGAVVSYQVALTSVPTSAVIITLTADPAVRISKNGVNWYSSLTITRTNRQSIIIYVQAVDNNVVDGSRTVQITQAITSSSDPNYPIGAVSGLAVNITDDDVASVVTTDGTNPISSVTVPHGGTTTYAIGLTSTPSSTISLKLTAGTGTQISLDGVTYKASLSINFSTKTTKTIYVKATSGSALVTSITQALVTSSDPNYPVGALPSLTVNIT